MRTPSSKQPGEPGGYPVRNSAALEKVQTGKATDSISRRNEERIAGSSSTT